MKVIINPINLFLIFLIAASASIFLFEVLIYLNNYRKRLNQTFNLLTPSHNTQELISLLSENLRTTLNLEEVYDIVSDIITKFFASQFILILDYDPTKENYLFRHAMGAEFIDDNHILSRSAPQLAKLLSQRSKPILLSELKIIALAQYQKDIDFYQNKEVRVILPLNVKGKNMGLVILGEKENGRDYNQEDLEILNIIGAQAAISMENAKQYCLIKDQKIKLASFNKTLAEKVKNQTEDLRSKNKKLEKLLVMRSEFLDITSHQLRTPVTVIKGVLSMLIENSVPENQKKKFMEGAFKKSIRLAEIIDDILEASEMDSYRFKIEAAPTELKPMLQEIYEDKIKEAHDKKIKLHLDLPRKKLPSVWADNNYFKHVIFNLINNSLQYTKKGSIIIKVSVEERKKAESGKKTKKVIIRVIDTGIGIPEDNLPKLFDKFARAKNATDTFTDGTGLGLFISKKIINGLPNADVYIEKSVLGQGTTMAVELSVVK
jgi:signal transduction histidine kinase